MSVRREVTGSPLTVTEPLDGVVTPASAFSSVVLPEPLSPMKATSCPGSTLSVVSARICFSPTRMATASASSRNAPCSERATKVAPSNSSR